MANTEHINEGMGSFREVSDRQLPTELDPECKASQARGATDAGMNERTMNESMREFLNQGPALDGHTDERGEFDGSVRSGNFDGQGRN